LIYHCESRDVAIVHINPLERAEMPRSATEILNRINEISFNSSLMREMRAIYFVTGLIDDGAVCENHLNKMLIHGISAEAEMSKLSVASKLCADWGFLLDLKEIGRKTAESWLGEHFEDLGRRSTVDIQVTYL